VRDGRAGVDVKLTGDLREVLSLLVVEIGKERNLRDAGRVHAPTLPTSQ